MYLFVLLEELLDLFDFVVQQLGWLLLVLFILNFLQKLTLTRYVAPRLANVAVNEQVLVPIRRVVILRFYQFFLAVNEFRVGVLELFLNGIKKLLV